MSADERRAQLLDVTEAIVGERGFHAVTMDGVARRAGVTRPVVYGHFRTLDGLLDAVVARFEARATAQLAAFLPRPGGAPDPAALLLEALRGYLDAVREDPATWRLVLMPPEGAPASLRERVGHGRAAVVAQLAELVRSAGLGPASPDPELTARTLSALGDEAARLVLTDPARYPPERIVAHARWLLGSVSSQTLSRS